MAKAKEPSRTLRDKQPGLDGRHRDTDGRISQKHGNTRIGTLRETYGHGFAEGRRADMKLSTLLEREGVESLSQYLSEGKHVPGVLGRSPATGRLVLKPASKGGSVSLHAAKTAVKNVGNGHKK